MKNKLNILFLCTGNSCRSQIAEGWANFLIGDIVNAFSAGINPNIVDPNAIKVMKEVGVDISTHTSKHIKEVQHIKFDIVITLCDHANETCPFFPGASKIVHNSFNDPPKLAKKLAMQGASIEEQLDCYRKVRDEIKEFVINLPNTIINTN